MFSIAKSLRNKRETLYKDMDLINLFSDILSILKISSFGYYSCDTYLYFHIQISYDNKLYFNFFMRLLRNTQMIKQRGSFKDHFKDQQIFQTIFNFTGVYKILKNSLGTTWRGIVH